MSVSRARRDTVTDARGNLPLLAPTRVVAGPMSLQAGAPSLELARRARAGERAEGNRCPSAWS